MGVVGVVAFGRVLDHVGWEVAEEGFGEGFEGSVDGGEGLEVAGFAVSWLREFGDGLARAVVGWAVSTRCS